MKDLIFLSPAKVNLFFLVLSKRNDGFHNIASLYQAIDLYDTLHIKLSSKKDSFTTSDCLLKWDETNLIYKAVSLFRKKTKKKFFLSIHLEKKIPHQAGLGGGSSNAATTLFALNEILDTKLSIKELATLGSLIGSDVTFFFSSGRAYCTGRGEIFRDIRLNEFFLSGMIAKPDFGLSTQLVYKNTNVESLDKIDPNIVLQSFKTSSLILQNDLEKGAFFLNNEMRILKERLKKMGFRYVIMTGSGSSFLCIGENVFINPIENVKYYSIKQTFRKEGQWYR